MHLPSARTTLATGAALAVAGAAAASMLQSASATKSSAPPNVAMNEIQVVATHNSYHRELAGAERDAQLEVDPGADPNLFYSHAPLDQQLAEQEVRSIELDVHTDPEGGLYRHPLVRRNAGLPPLRDPAWSEPGTKVFHIVDADYNTTCVQLTRCLSQVKAWSDANPNHVPLVIMLEFKSSEDRFERLGGVESPPWNKDRFGELEDEIRSVFAADDLITPDDVRDPGKTLEQSVLDGGWPSLREAAGRVMFAMDNTNAVRGAYLAGNPNLEGRLLFTDSAPGTPSAAFMKRNNPRGANRAEIADLVRRGYFVRTRSDEPMGTVLRGDTQMRDDALASGAQLVSTDFPVAGMAAPWNSDFFVSLPGDTPARCNPVSTSVSCRTSLLEP
jgi:calcium-dependent phosphoinositide phospholipase C